MTELRECGKIKYIKEDAETLVKELKRKYKKVFGHTGRQEKRVYFCEDCQSYHLTSISQTEWELRIKKTKNKQKNHYIKRDKNIQQIILANKKSNKNE